MEEMQKSLQEMLERVLSEKFDKFFPELKMRAGEGTSLRARVGDFRKDLDAVKQEQVAWPMPQERAPPPANRAARFAYGGPPAPCDSTEATADATAVQGLVVPDPLADALSTLTSCSTERLTQVEAVAQQIGADSVPERWSMLEEKLEVKLKPLEAKLSPLATDLRARVGAITTHLDAVQRARAPAAHPRDPAQVHISGAGNGVPQPYVPPHDTGEPEDHLWGHVDEEFGPEYAHRGDEVPRGCRGIRHDDDDCPDRRDVRHDDDDYNDRRDGFRLKPPKHAFSVFKGYKACWLPLLPKQTEAADADEALVVPLDGEWIWHCHRLNPTQCIKDCKRLYGRILDTNNVKSIQAKSKDQVEKVWTELYPGEPVELQCTSPSEDSVYLSDGTAGGISYDLVSAVKRQFSFIYQVGTPNMHYHCFLEEIKQEAAYYSDIDGLNGSKLFGSEKRASLDGCSGPDTGVGSGRKAVRSALNPVKLEDDMPREGETTFTMFASLLDSAIQGLMPFLDAILQFERTCRNASESLRYAATGKVWSLLSYLYGKANEELPGELFMSPTTSHQEACRYVATDLTAQLCLRIVLWLEGLSYESFDLEKKVRGSYVGSYLPSSGVWHHTQRYLKRRNNDSNIVKHVDFDAPTREVAQLLPDDKKDEDIWTLLRAGRLDEALFPSLEAMLKNGNARTLQAIELESGIGRQWRLRKWASYCASEKIAEHDGGQYEMDVYALQCSNLKRTLPICTDEESACWAMAKSWLDVKVDLELSQYQTSRQEEKGFDDDMNGTQRDPENWPYHVLDQQPRDIAALLQKLHSIDLVHETVSQACREQEELAGVYASQLERDVCIDLFVEMMELSLNSSLHTMYKLFLSSVEYLPFSSGDPSKACFEEIIEGVLSRSRETKPHEYNADFSDLAERHHLQTLQKAMVIQWLCFTPPPSIPGFQMITGKLLMRALMHNNTLFREFSLISMRRVPELPVGPHKLLATLAEPLKQKENLFSLEYQEVSDNLEEFEDWHEYYFRDATYRGWLRCERENSYVPPEMLSAEEKDQAVAATTQTLELAFKLFGSFKVVDRISENAPQPEAILDRHMVKQGKAATVQILIQWSSLPVDCATWEDYYVLKARFLMRQSGMHLQLKGRQLSHPHLLTRWCLTY